MERFNFPYHQFQTNYPDRGQILKMAGNWDYTVEPHAPVSREFILKFPLFKYFPEDEVAGLSVRERQYCANLLEDFYAQHETYKAFIYEHPRHGDQIVKFKKPLNLPSGKIGEEGVIRDITLTLREMRYT